MAFSSSSSRPTNYTPVRNYTPVSSTPQRNFSPAGVPVASSTTGGTIFQHGQNQYVAPISPTVAANQFSPTPAPKPTPAPSQPQNTFNPNDFNSILSQFPGYAGWNSQAALADFANTQGAGKGIQQGPSQEDISREINSIFGESEGLLNNIESSTRSGEQDFYSQYSKPYEAQMPMFSQQRDAALTSNTQQMEGEKMREQNALASARQLFNELRQSNTQRFGSSSAGEFSSDILGREFQRNVGQVQNTAGENIRKLLDQSNTIKTQYDAQVNALNQQKEGALAQARDVFRQRLDAINNTRLGLVQNKAAAKLDALRELRNQALAIQNAASQQQMQLQQMVTQADLQLRNALAGFQAQSGQQVNLSPLPGAQSIYSSVAPSQNTGGGALMGQLNRRRIDEQGNYLA